MMMTMGTKNLKMWISEKLPNRLATKIFRGLALGTLIVAATLLYISMIQGEARSPSASDETTWALQAPVYMGPEDPEVAEMPYDDLLKSFVGIPAPRSEATDRFFPGGED